MGLPHSCQEVEQGLIDQAKSPVHLSRIALQCNKLHIWENVNY